MSERNIAWREGARNANEEDYFHERAHLDSKDTRRTFCAGFDRGWEAMRASIVTLERQRNELYKALREYKRLRDQYRPDPAPHEWAACEERIDAALRAAEGAE